MERIRAVPRGDAPVRWVFAGDSITHGAAHTIGWRDYTELFSERVRWELRRTRDVVIKTGISGWTSPISRRTSTGRSSSFGPSASRSCSG